MKNKQLYVYAYSSGSTYTCHIANEEGDRHERQPLCGARILEHHKEVDTCFPAGYHFCKRCENIKKTDRMKEQKP